MHIVEADSGQITGNLAVSQLDYGAGKVKLTTRPITGVRNGERFSLLVSRQGLGLNDHPLSLEAKGNVLMLMIPATGQSVEMQPMDQDEYREKLTEFAQALNANDVGLLPDE